MIGMILTNFFSLFSSYSLASTAGLVSERSGTVNIAIDGKMIIGGLIFTLLIAGPFAPLGVGGMFLAILMSALGSMLYSLLLAIPTINMYSDHVITGTAINILATAISLLVVFMITDQASMGIEYLSLGKIGGNNGMEITSLIFTTMSISIMGAIWVFMEKTKWGLRLKTAGENPYSLAAAGVSVARTRYFGLLLAGFLSGIAGAIAMTTLAGTFNGHVSGMGFVAMAILIFGRWNIWGIMGGTVIMSLTMAIARSWTLFGIDFPVEVIQMLPFIMPILSLILMKVLYTDKGKGLYGGAPKAAGRPFKKDAR